MILFVGDKPSPRMKRGARAFHGAACEKRLMGWINRLGGDPEYLVNSESNTGDIRLINLWILLDQPIVALGNNASKKLKKAGAKHFKLPHPSGLNRKLNDQEYIDSELHKCYLWLKEHGCAVSATTGNQKK